VAILEHTEHVLSPEKPCLTPLIRGGRPDWATRHSWLNGQEFVVLTWAALTSAPARPSGLRVFERSWQGKQHLSGRAATGHLVATYVDADRKLNHF
jgi:hypothetical protein